MKDLYSDDLQAAYDAEISALGVVALSKYRDSDAKLWAVVWRMVDSHPWITCKRLHHRVLSYTNHDVDKALDDSRVTLQDLDVSDYSRVLAFGCMVADVKQAAIRKQEEEESAEKKTRQQYVQALREIAKENAPKVCDFLLAGAGPQGMGWLEDDGGVYRVTEKGAAVLGEISEKQ